MCVRREVSGRAGHGDSQHAGTHGTLVSMHFAIRAPDGITLPGAYEHPILHSVSEFAAEFLENEENIFP